MEFLDISSLGTAYRHAAKIEHKFKQKKRDFGFANQKQGKGAPKPQKKSTKPRHGGPRKPAKAASKEQHREAKEGHGKVV